MLGEDVYRQREISKHEAAAAQEIKPICTVREYGGKLGVFRENEAEPYMIIDVNTSLLSDFDREQFRDGTRIFSETELKKLIEDFSD